MVHDTLEPEVFYHSVSKTMLLNTIMRPVHNIHVYDILQSVILF